MYHKILTPLLQAFICSLTFFALAAQATTLNTHSGSDPSSLDPHAIGGVWENRIVGDMFEGLMTEDPKANPVPGVASSYTLSDDGLVYTFKLRPEAKWSDGTPVTAADFVYAFQRIMDPATAANFAFLQYPIKNAEAINKGNLSKDQLGVVALDDHTLRITLENPTPFFLTGLTHYTAYPIPRHAVEKYGDQWAKADNIITNGPYRAVEWLSGSHVRSVKNENYHAADTVAIEEVIYHIMEDESAALRRYEAGELDLLSAFPLDQLDRLRAEIGDQLYIAPFLGLYFYTLNVNHKPLDDIRVREALSLGINREVITSQILGSGEVPAYSWVPPGTANYAQVATISWQDMSQTERLARAKRLLQQAGYGPGGQPLKFVLRYNTNDNHRRVAVAVAAMWKELDIDVELFNSEAKVHYNDLGEQNFEVARAAWLPDYNDPIALLDLLSSDNNYNFGAWQNAEYDQLIANSEQETDLVKRAEILYQAERIAMDNFASIPIYHYVSQNIVSPKIGGFQTNVYDIHRTRYLTKQE